MNVYVVRHGLTDYNIQKIYQGRVDVPLNEEGRKQAEETAQQFKGIKIDNILVSPLSRARDTASYIEEVTGVKAEIVDGLIERGYGDMEGHSATPECNTPILVDYDRNYNLHGVEPIKEMIERVKVCLDQIMKKYKGKDIVLVTHAGVTQGIEIYFNGLPQDKNIEKLTLKNCEVRKYENVKAHEDVER